MSIGLLALRSFKQLSKNVFLKAIIPKLSTASAVHTLDKIGNREVVGYGWNGEPSYMDRADYPFPSTRFREDTKEIAALRQKEKEDWKLLNMNEKKALYRSSFRQTFAEFQAPTGEWKFIVAIALYACAIGTFATLLLHWCVYEELPDSFDEKHQKAQLKRMLDLEVNPIHGLSSKWNYQTNKWK